MRRDEFINWLFSLSATEIWRISLQGSWRKRDWDFHQFGTFPVGLLSVIAFFLRFGTICNLIEQTSFWPCSFHLSVSDLQSHFFFSSMIWRIVKETFVNIRYRTQIKSYFNWSTKPNDHENRRSPLAWKCGFLFMKFWFDTKEIDSEAVCHCTIAWKAKLSECNPW